MVKSQKEENQMLRRKKVENRIDEPELSVEIERKNNNLLLHRVEIKKQGSKRPFKGYSKMERKKL